MTKEELVKKERYDFDDLVEIVAILRGPQGCPWDKVQTHESMKICLIEECYEVIEAIDNKDDENLREELGDVLLQVVMHARIASEEYRFELNDVIDELAKKLVRRHQHVFGSDVGELNPDGSLAKWEEVKKQEKQGKKQEDGVLKSVPKAFPAMVRANKVLKKAEKEYEYSVSAADVVGSLDELLRKIKNGESLNEDIEEFLLQSVNLCRVSGENPELSLTNATNRFIEKYEK